MTTTSGGEPATAKQVLDELRVPVDLKKLTLVLFGAIAVLFVANIPAAAVASDGERFFFDHPQAKWFLLDAERNIPTLFACLQIAACMGVAALHAVLSRIDETGDGLRWGALAVGFGYLTLDEGLQIHERLEDLDLGAVPVVGSFSWVILAVPVVIVVALAFLPWVFRQPAGMRRGMLLGGGLYVFGAVVMEAVGGAIVDSLGFGHPLYAIASTVEETAELVGIALFLLAAVRHLLDRLGGRAVRLVRVED